MGIDRVRESLALRMRSKRAFDLTSILFHPLPGSLVRRCKLLRSLSSRNSSCRIQVLLQSQFQLINNSNRRYLGGRRISSFDCIWSLEYCCQREQLVEGTGTTTRTATRRSEKVRKEFQIFLSSPLKICHLKFSKLINQWQSLCLFLLTTFCVLCLLLASQNQEQRRSRRLGS